MSLPRDRQRSSIRVVTYNILLGGARREDLIMAVLARTGADVIALQEVTEVGFARRLAVALGMEVVVGEPSDGLGLNLALLSRRPIAAWRNHRHHGRMLRSHLEGQIDVGRGRRLGVHCVHLAARFGERANGEFRRMRELTAVLGGIELDEQRPHLLLGDFNALGPGDTVAATRFFSTMASLRRAGLLIADSDGLVGPRRRADVGDSLDAAWRAAGIDPRLDVGVPRLPKIVGPLTGRIPPLPSLDRWLGRFIERRTIQHLLDQGYLDCYRRMHPRARGYTCATWLPAARVDYIFADAVAAAAMVRCDLVGSRALPDPDVSVASDHLPLLADFDFKPRTPAPGRARTAPASQAAGGGGFGPGTRGSSPGKRLITTR